MLHNVSAIELVDILHLTMHAPVRSGLSLGPFQAALHADVALVGRIDERAGLLRAMVDQIPLVLIGPRRHGKTVLLRAAAAQATAQGIVVLHLDTESYESLELLAQAILSSATRYLYDSPDEARRRLAELVPQLHPEVTLDSHSASLHVTLGARTPGKGVRRDALPILTTVLDAVDALAGDTGKRVVLVLDEVQQLLDQGGTATERELRTLVQRHTHLSYILAGSATRELASLTARGRLFAKLGGRILLGPLPRDEFLDFLQAGFEISGFQVEPGALEVLLDLAQEVPYDVQRLAHACWEWLRADPTRWLSVGAVADSRTRLVRQEGPAYTQLWIGLHKAQKIAIKAVVLEGGLGLMGEEALSRYRLGVSTMRQALRALEKRGLIRAEGSPGDQGPGRYRLIDPFFGTWLRMVQEH